MVDPYFEILLKQWEDSEDDNNNNNTNDDEQTSYDMDQWQAYVPNID